MSVTLIFVHVGDVDVDQVREGIRGFGIGFTSAMLATLKRTAPGADIDGAAAGFADVDTATADFEAYALDQLGSGPKAAEQLTHWPALGMDLPIDLVKLQLEGLRDRGLIDFDEATGTYFIVPTEA